VKRWLGAGCRSGAVGRRHTLERAEIPGVSELASSATS